MLIFKPKRSLTYIKFYIWSSNQTAYNWQSMYVRTFLFAVLKWSVNALLDKCYLEAKHILKILSNETF